VKKLCCWHAILVGVLGFGCSQSADEPALEGALQMFIVDHADGSHEVGYALEIEAGRYVGLEFSSPPRFETGDRIAVRGEIMQRAASRADGVGEELWRVDSVELVERAAAAVASLQQPLATGEPQTVKAALVLLNFSGVTAQSFTKTNADERLTTVAAYYDEVSYGNWKVEGDSFGPYTVAKPANCNLDTIGNLARQAAIDNGVSINDYEHVGVTLPSNDASALNCACGLAYVGRTPAQGSPDVADTSLYTCTDSNAFAHEMGHGFGLHHASTASCGGVHYKRDGYTSCSVAEYGNQFNTMGNGLGHFSAFQKSTMQWLDDCNNVVVTKDGTFDVYAMQSSTTSIQSLQIPNGETRDGNDLYYWVEFRNPALADFNAKDGGTVREKGTGVHIDVAADHRVDDGDRRPLLLDLADGAPGNFDDPRLLTGKSFVDPDSRVTIKVLSTSAEKASIEVTFPSGGTGENLCGNGLTPPGVDGPPGRLFQHCSFTGWSAALDVGEYTTADLVGLGAVDNDASSISLEEGYEADLFDGDNFTGNMVTVTATSSCLVEQSFNDVLSSVRIRAVEVGSGGSGGVGGMTAGSGGAAGSAGAVNAGSGGELATGGIGGASAGSAGALAAAGSGGGGAGSPTTMNASRPVPSTDSGCACTVAGERNSPHGALASLISALGLGVVFARRRRR
jgi:hypothetical protein